MLVPAGDYASEKAILSAAEELPHVKSATGLANIEIEDGRVLTDSYTPRMFSMLLNIDYEQAQLLYAAYGVEHEQYQAVFGNAEAYSVPLIDMFLYLFEKIDQGIVTLDDASQETLDSLRGELERGEAQLRGVNWDRMVITADIPVEGEDSITLVDSLRSLADGYYGEGKCLVIGNITSARELRETFSGDSMLINVLTITFVLLLLPCLATGALAAEDDAETVRISTAEELMELAANCVSDTWSQGKTILLEDDINLTGLDFTPIPLLSGTFDGQGHNIIGVSFDAAGSTQGLFRMVLAAGEVRNVRVSGTIKASGTGESIGGIAGQIEPHAEWNFTGGGLSSMRSGLYELESSMNTMLGNMGVGMADAGYLMQDAIDIVSDSIDIINGSAGDDPSGWGGIDDDTSAQLDANFEQLIEIMNSLAGIVSDETLTYDMQDVSAAMTDVSAAMTEMLYGLGSASDALNITDVSDANDPDTAACAVVNGLNRAAVSADTNVGGIAGNIALDVSFDRED